MTAQWNNSIATLLWTKQRKKWKCWGMDGPFEILIKISATIRRMIGNKKSNSLMDAKDQWLYEWAKKIPGLWEDMCRMQHELPLLEGLQEPQQKSTQCKTQGDA